MTLGWPWPISSQGQIGHIGFCMGKSENYILFGNYCSHRPQIWFKYFNKCVTEVKWVSKVKVIWPWPKVTQISKLKLVFLGNYLVIWNKISFESLWVNGNENLYKWVGSHDQDGRHAHIWWKTLKKSSSPEPSDWWPWNLVCSIVYKSAT